MENPRHSTEGSGEGPPRPSGLEAATGAPIVGDPAVPVTPDAATADLVLITRNPRSGAASSTSQVSAVRESLERHRLSVEMLASGDSLAERVTSEGSRLRAVLVAGGDGTFHRVLNETPPGTPLAVTPFGTENLLAKQLGQRSGAEAIARTLTAGRLIRLDAGVANGRLFSLMAGVGFDAEAVRRLESTRRGHIRLTSWIQPIWQTIRSYEYPPLRVYSSAAGGSWGDPAVVRWVFVVNLPRYARGLRLTPRAVGTDGQLDVCTFRRGGFLSGLWYLGWLACRGHERLSGCRIHQSPRLRVESDRPVPYQLDGEPAGMLPLEIEVAPQRLSVWVPPGD